MAKALVFKGDKKPKKRKRTADNDDKTNQALSAPTSVDNRDSYTGDHVDPDNDDRWVSADQPSDISGPLMVVMQSSAGDKPYALSCDATGKVFALPIENIVDGNVSSAEPHDVRQVWVANKAPGTENLRFKGAHGKFLSCDSHGLLSASAEAVSTLESFTIVPAKSPSSLAVFHIKTAQGNYIRIKSPSLSASSKSLEIRGDADSCDSESTVLRLRMQARFKPSIKLAKDERIKDKVSRSDLETAVGRKLEDNEVRRLKKARREGDYHEQLLMLKVKGKHDKYSY
ncbi:hypothetical protein Cpir12675_004246 [Ceratocystis pirilliformis]|uniref:Protein frg1 n=1 Tax=Ceratocystis pirilliformis TaxID=259994 RepID=A0ABR3YZ34_9PEZI